MLVGFWYTRIQARKAAIKALIMNRIGDFFLLVAILIFLRFFKTTDFQVIFALSPYFIDVRFDSYLLEGYRVVDVAAIFLLFAAVGKSAQIGLHTWLPDAM